jgi:serine/threonine-protein kinase
MSRLMAIGGMARIYSAHRRHDHRPVAIKIFQPPRGQEPKYREYMLHEAHALSVAASPFVVQLLDHGVFVGQPFLVLEWLGGCTLADAMVTDTPPSFERAVSIFRKLLDAVEALHERGVIHADLKPENVMLSPHDGDERVRLLDLGAARVNGKAVVQRDEVFGTPGYIAPEVAAGEPLEPSSDVYSAGVLLFELLSGLRPSSGTGSSVCDAVDAVVATALSPSRAHRYMDVPHLRHAFEQALGTEAPGEPSDDDHPITRPIRLPSAS